MKLSRTGIVALSKQYRSVLKKCFLINAGLFMLATPAMAIDDNTQGSGDTTTPDSSVVNIVSGGVITSQTGVTVGLVGTDDAQTGEDASFSLTENVTINKQLTLHDKVTLTTNNNSTLTVYGYLTQTASGSNISGVDVIINKGTIADDKTEGELVLGNNLTVGNMTFTDGTGVYLYKTDEDYASDLNKTLTIADGKTITFVNNNYIKGAADSSLTISGGSVVNSGTLTVDNKTTFSNTTLTNNGTITGNVAFDNGSTYAVTLDGTKRVNGTITLNGDTTLAASLGTDKSFDNGATYSLATKVEGNGNWTSTLYNYEFDENDDKNTITNITTKSSEDIATSTGATNNAASAVSAVISGSATTSNEAFNKIATSINDGLQSSDASVRAAALKTVEQMSSDTTSSAQSSTVASASATFGAVGTRLSGGSVASSTSGMNSGDSYLEGGAVWAQTMINSASLDNSFDSDSNGVAFGAEKQINDNVKAGIGYAYSNTDIDTSSRSTDADTNTFFVYGEYKPSNWYVNGIASYSFASYDESSNTKTASYDVDAIGLQVMSGYDMAVQNVDVTPEAGLRYVKVSQDSYTDTLDSKISGDDSDILTAVVGAKAGKTFALENGSTLRPEVKAALTYDLFNDDANSIVTLANGSTYTTTGEALDKFGMEFGVGFTADVNEQVELSLGYEGKFRSDYEDHTGTLNVKYKF
ncbi:MAG: autotransporter domain-containing protein [Alphaproteobacteria bacterium]